MMGIKSILQLLLALGTLCVASFGVPGAAGCSVEDQKALLAFKAQFNDPTGILKSWDPIQPDCCWWKGVRCEFQAPGRVSSLSLQPSSPSETGVLTVRKGVKGVGSSLGDLTALTFLVLAQVRFSFQHPVPATLAKLQNLQTLGLIGTQCIGPTVPCFLSTLPKLNDVTITGNRFPNGIPGSFGNMKELGLLSLESNGMKTLGTSASNLTKLTKLNNFSVAGNAIQGPIPQWVGALAPMQMPGKDIYLQSNNFTGRIPKSLSSLSVGSFRPGNLGLCGPPLARCR